MSSDVDSLTELTIGDSGGGDRYHIVDMTGPSSKYITQTNSLKVTHTRDKYFTARDFISVSTNGAELTQVELPTNDIMVDAAGFSTSTSEKIQFWYKFESNWNAGTVTFKLDWTNTGGASAETIDFDLAAHSYANDDALDVALGGTPANVTDTWTAQNDYQETSFSSTITLGGTPADGQLNLFQLSRDIANDNLAGDAKIMGITLRYTVTDLASS